MGKKEEKKNKIFAQVEETGNSFQGNSFPLSYPTPQAHFRPSSLHIPTLPSKSGKKEKEKRKKEKNGIREITKSFEQRLARSCRRALKSLYFSASASLFKLLEIVTEI